MDGGFNNGPGGFGGQYGGGGQPFPQGQGQGQQQYPQQQAQQQVGNQNQGFPQQMMPSTTTHTYYGPNFQVMFGNPGGYDVNFRMPGMMGGQPSGIGQQGYFPQQQPQQHIHAASASNQSYQGGAGPSPQFGCPP
jgi:hypothetical protein